MKCLHIVPIMFAALVVAAPLPAQPVTPSLTACEAAPFVPAGEAPDLHGQWDFLIQVGATPSPGLMAIGHMDGAYAGSITPYRANTVVVRRLTLDRGAVHMLVATREGEVRFEGQLIGGPDTMCGRVLYHSGQVLQMVAVRRPTNSVPR